MKTTKIELWKILEHKFCVDLKNDFSNKDIKAWINHFVPNEKVNIYQHGKGKTTRIYTGNLFSSLINVRIPAKLMAKIYFQKLKKQNYSHSEIELLGIRQNVENENTAEAHIRFLRYDNSGRMYESAMGLYSLVKRKNLWLIKEMSIYDDDVNSMDSVNLSDMWRPEK